MSDFALTTKDDRASNDVARVVDRLAHQRAPFERPLTEAEIRIINKFLD